MRIIEQITPPKAVATLFILWCILGVALFRDYSVSWDEPAERVSGICSETVMQENLAGKKVPQQYYDLWQGDRFYGLAFQHILLAAERVYTGSKINPIRYASRDIWYLRHFMNFFAVTVGLVALYFSAKMLKSPEQSEYYPVLAVLGFMLMPRFFAESFYNVKDIILLAGFMLAGSSLFSMMKKRTMVSVALFALTAAFVSAIRLQGVVFFLIGLVRIITWLRPSLIRRLGMAGVFTLLFISFLVLFYPVSWENPLQFFVDAVKYMSSHPWRGHVLFMGERFISTGMPWYYIAVWMAVTIPVPLILLGLTGSIFDAKRVIRKCRSFRRVIVLLRGNGTAALRFQIRCGLILMFWGGLLFFSLFSNVFYNSWRHYYFLAWPLLFLIADGMCFVWQHVKNNFVMRRCMQTALFLFVVYIVAWNINAHPYQNCYFNILAGNPNGRFETDYWRLSNTEAFRRIAEYSKENNKISTVRLSLTCYSALVMLPKMDSQYIKILNPNEKFEFYVWYDRPVGEKIRQDVIFEEKYCRDLFGKDVLLYTTLKLK